MIGWSLWTSGTFIMSRTLPRRLTNHLDSSGTSMFLFLWTWRRVPENNEQRGLTSDYKRFPLPSSVKSLITNRCVLKVTSLFFFHFLWDHSSILFIPYAVSNHEWWENEEKKDNDKKDHASRIQKRRNVHRWAKRQTFLGFFWYRLEASPSNRA